MGAALPHLPADLRPVLPYPYTVSEAGWSAWQLGS
jgi:hypothetical protein